jgi:hypothetical protein
MGEDKSKSSHSHRRGLTVQEEKYGNKGKVCPQKGNDIRGRFLTVYSFKHLEPCSVLPQFTVEVIYFVLVVSCF